VFQGSPLLGQLRSLALQQRALHQHQLLPGHHLRGGARSHAPAISRPAACWLMVMMMVMMVQVGGCCRSLTPAGALLPSCWPRLRAPGLPAQAPWQAPSPAAAASGPGQPLLALPPLLLLAPVRSAAAAPGVQTRQPALLMH
jgi:hypothetical protein